MRKKIIPKNCAHPVYHCSDGIDTVYCWAFLNERFEVCPHKDCECYKEIISTSKTRKKLNRLMAEMDADMESFFGRENKDENKSRT